MQPDERDPTKAEEWLRRARSNLLRAKAPKNDPEILFEDLCFDAQQAAEKAIKGLLVHLQIPFPKTHSISDLLTLVSAAGIEISAEISEAAELTLYAVESRYPGILEAVEEEQYLKAVELADRVVAWVERTIRQKTPQEAP